MTKYYDINQGSFDKNGKYCTPKFPLENPENLKINLESATAKEVTQEEASRIPNWGHGFFKLEDGICTPLSENWDSSG